MTPQSYRILPVGVIHHTDDAACIEISQPYETALLGLEGFSHITVLYWFHENDTPQLRGILQVHPKKNKDLPLTGVFATHSPVRPNPIAMTFCNILRIDGLSIFIDGIDARDGSPVIDIKPYIPIDKLRAAEIKIPAWVSSARGNHSVDK